MRCPSCGDDATRVVDSRDSRDGDEIRRRRECEECGFRFTTRERFDQQLPKVIKRDRRREEYDRSKLLRGIASACVKRPVAVDAIERLVDRIERSLHDGGEREVESRLIGERVMAELAALDSVAAVRFASVYQRFESSGDYAAFIAALEAGADVGAGEPPERSRSAGRGGTADDEPT